MALFPALTEKCCQNLLTPAAVVRDGMTRLEGVWDDSKNQKHESPGSRPGLETGYWTPPVVINDSPARNGVKTVG
jgi:hypothetical protein